MTFTIAVPAQDLAFDCGADETVLDAVERAGYVIPYSCRKGVCSSCEGRLVSGEALVRGQGLRTGPAEAVLFCQARPQTDIAIAPTRIHRAAPPSRKVYDAKVRRLERPAASVAIISLRLPIGRRAAFRAGQYLRVLMPDGDSRNYSMANPPQRSDELELHIRHVPGGRFSEGVLAQLGKGSILRVELPYGEFSLSGNEAIPAILIATGTGFAPMKSLMEDLIRSGGQRPVHLYWGANTESDLYLDGLARRWADEHPWLTYTPVVSGSSQGWSGRSGFVHRAVAADYPDMGAVEVYACGAPLMIEAARTEFTTRLGLAHDAFFSDAFVPSGDATPPS